jgi:uncharacterized protein (TIGR02145 family)
LTLIVSACGNSELKDSNLHDEDGASEQSQGITIIDESLSEVQMDSQVWSNRNLNIGKFRNGDPIPEAKSPEEWKNAGKNRQPAWCAYKFDNSNIEKFGRLYNFYAVIDTRGLAPSGWRIPTEEDFKELHEYCGGKYENSDSFNGISGYAKRMRSKAGWNNNYNGSNECQFSALPGGMCTYDGGFLDKGSAGYWWSSTRDTLGLNWQEWNSSSCISARVSIYDTDPFINRDSGAEGRSVRCVKEN